MPGEVVADAYPFALPPGAVPDGITVVVYRKLADGSFANLDVARFPLPMKITTEHGDTAIASLRALLSLCSFSPRMLWLLGQEAVFDQPGAQLNA